MTQQFHSRVYIQKPKCTLMFIAALFTIAKIWNEPKHPSIDEWIKKMWYIHIYGKKVEVLVAQSCPAVCDPMDYSFPGSSVHGILQARILEWVAISFSRGSSWPRDRTHIFCLASGFFNTEPRGKPTEPPGEPPKPQCDATKHWIGWLN